MEALFSQIKGTIVLRPYFAAFFLAYVLACTLRLGLKRALLFGVAGYLIAWAAEYSSIHCGIPFGRYYYLCQTKGRELWVLGVPFMDSMSFVFLSYASYSMALSAMGRGGGFHPVKNGRVWLPLKKGLLGALFCVYLDIIIDPLALRGNRWFLGQIYEYPEKGVYFGIPISNFIGWFIVGFVLICALQLIDRLLTARNASDLVGPARAWSCLPGPALYLSIVVFNLSVTLGIGEYNLFWAGAFIMLLPFVLFVLLARNSSPWSRSP